VLTADLVRARRSGNSLVVQRFRGDDRARAEEYGRAIVDTLAECMYQSREEATAALAEIPRETRDQKLFDGLVKLVFDRCTFEGGSHEQAESWRARLFLAAAEARRVQGATFDRAAFLAAQAVEEKLTGEEAVDHLLQRLWSDLPGRDRLVHVARILPEALVDAYVFAQYQAVLLRARELRIRVEKPRAEDLRKFLRTLKFHRLLFRAEVPANVQEAAAAAPELQITLDGPLSLFSANTKYGLALAIAASHLPLLGVFVAEADLLWGKERRIIGFTFATDDLPPRVAPTPQSPEDAATGRQGGDDEADEPDEIARLQAAWATRKSPWTVTVADEILVAPGGDVVVPDLFFHRRGEDGVGVTIALEVLGFWSRDAVFRRLEAAAQGFAPQRGAALPVLFCASERLRVSETVAGEDALGGLYVFKGALRASALETHLDDLARRWQARAAEATPAMKVRAAEATPATKVRVPRDPTPTKVSPKKSRKQKVTSKDPSA